MSPVPTRRPYPVLLADDPAGRLDAVRRGLEEEGIPVRYVRGAQETLQALREGVYSIVAIPERPGDAHGETLLRKSARRGDGPLPILLREAGAGPLPATLPNDTIVLPIENAAEIVSTIAGAYRERAGSAALDAIVGETEEIRQIKQVIRQVAPTKLNVLITGESGTGKEIVARAIHDFSPRRNAPFIAVNAGALPEGVLESELFGHEKGAFTGAHAVRAGRFELANRGTLFLDEIGDMPASIQVKLLRVLEESRFLRVGGMRNIEVDVRLIAATNADLETAVESGRFRRDLFFRLNVIHIGIPPLRERRADIPMLVARFVDSVAREHELKPVRFTDDAMGLLVAHHWPGNIRELKNLIEKTAVLYAGRDIEPELIEQTFGRRIRRGANLPALVGGSHDEPDRELIYRTLHAIRAEIAELRAAMLARGIVRGRADDVGDVGAGSAGVARPLDPFRGRFDRRSGYDSDGAEASALGEAIEPIEMDDSTIGEADEARTAYAGGGAAPGRELPLSLADLERDAIARALQRTGGNRRRAADLLGIGERTLYRKIHEYRLERRSKNP